MAVFNSLLLTQRLETVSYRFRQTFASKCLSSLPGAKLELLSHIYLIINISFSRSFKFPESITPSLLTPARMILSEKSPRALARRQQEDKNIQSVVDTPHTDSVRVSKSNTRSLPIRFSPTGGNAEIEQNLESQRPLPHTPSSRRSGASGSHYPKSAETDIEEDDGADLAREEGRLMDQNAARLHQLSEPRTPPNPPRILTEHGLVASLPLLEDSPMGQIIRQGWKPDSGFGEWLPGHGPQTCDSPSAAVGQTDHVDDAVTPAEMLISLQAQYAEAEEQDQARFEFAIAMYLQRNDPENV